MLGVETAADKSLGRIAAIALARPPLLPACCCRYEKTWATNHLGHFYLVHLLLPALQPPARVVMTSSGTHDPKTKAPVPVPKWSTPTDISMPSAAAAADAASTSSSSSAKFNGMQAYTNSKLCNIYMAYQLAAKMKEQGKDITATAYGKLGWEDSIKNKFISWVVACAMQGGVKHVCAVVRKVTAGTTDVPAAHGLVHHSSACGWPSKTVGDCE